VTFLNFAYGSNLSSCRLRARTSSARSLGVARLDGRALAWHKRSVDGSGKCDIVAHKTAVVWGVVFEIARSEKPLLDAAEGLHQGYALTDVSVVLDGGLVVAQAYVATDLDATALPYHWYKAFVVAGAAEHGLPAPYRAQLAATLSVPDPDRARAARNARILGRT
jgi:gamma-glutamylcyclotransferase